jgi:hypothetical protein
MKTEIIYGFHPVFEALKAARRKVFKVQIAGDKPSGRLEKVAALAASLNVDVNLVKTFRLNQLAGTTQHQGVGAAVSLWSASFLWQILHILSINSDPHIRINYWCYWIVSWIPRIWGLSSEPQSLSVLTLLSFPKTDLHHPHPLFPRRPPAPWST